MNNYGQIKLVRELHDEMKEIATFACKEWAAGSGSTFTGDDFIRDWDEKLAFLKRAFALARSASQSSRPRSSHGPK